MKNISWSSTCGSGISNAPEPSCCVSCDVGGKASGDIGLSGEDCRARGTLVNREGHSEGRCVSDAGGDAGGGPHVLR